MPKDLSRLLASGMDLREEYEKASKTLESIGLSTYEARGYIALVAHGFGSAEIVAETAGIPRTSAYKVLQSLCSKGFAFAAQGRPMIFRPEVPANIKERVMKQLSDTFDKLDAVHEVLRDKGDPQLVYTITEKERVLKKIGELMDSATESFMVSTPTFSEIREELRKNIENAVKRGIKFTVITAPMQKVLDGIDIHRKKNLIATDVIADGQTALIASPDLSACGFTDNAYLAKHLENFLQILMEHEG